MKKSLSKKILIGNILSFVVLLGSCTNQGLPTNNTTNTGSLSEKYVPKFLDNNGKRVFHFNNGDILKSNVSYLDNNNKEILSYSKTYKAIDIGDDLDLSIKSEASDEKKVKDLIEKLESIEKESSKNLLFLPIEEKFSNDDLKNSSSLNPFSSTSNIVSLDELYSFLDKWDEYKGGKEDKGVNGGDFIEFLNYNNISVDRFFYLYKGLGLSLSELEALLKKVSDISKESDTEATELFLLINYLKVSWKDFMKELEANGISEDKLIQDIKSKNITFRQILELVKEYRNNYKEAVKKIVEYLKDPSKFKILESGELAFEVSKFVLKELQTDNFEAESGKLSVIKSGDSSLLDYINARSTKSGKINFKFIDESLVPAWDSCLTKVFGKCVPGPTLKPLNATMLETEIELDGSCDAKNVKDNSGHYIPSAVFKVLKNDQKYPGIKGTLKVLQDDPINIATVADVNPYLRLHITADLRFLNIKWDGVFSGNSNATMTVVGKDPYSQSCFFNSDKSSNSFK